MRGHAAKISEMKCNACCPTRIHSNNFEILSYLDSVNIHSRESKEIIMIWSCFFHQIIVHVEEIDSTEYVSLYISLLYGAANQNMA